MTLEESTFAKYVGKPVLLDSNLLLILLIGSLDTALITVFKRTVRYSVEHYELLLRLLESFSGVITTPHVLTEVSNLANSLPEWQKPAWAGHFGLRMADFQEIYRDSAALAQNSSFPAFGLTDSALRDLSATTLLLTEDRRLIGHLRTLNIDALHFDDLFIIAKALESSL